MMRKLSVLLVLIAVSMLFAACSWFKSPTGPSDDWPPLPRPPADPAPYTSFFDPINLSEDEWELTLKFSTFTPPPGSLIFPVPYAYDMRNPCPQYCLYYWATLSLAKEPPNNVTCNCPNWGAGTLLYLSYNGVDKGQQIGGANLGRLPELGLETTFGNAGTNHQIPFFHVPTHIIAEWGYHFITGNGTSIKKNGNRAIPTWYTRG